YLGVYVGTSAEWAREVLEVIQAELRAAAAHGLKPDELTRTRNQIKGSLLLGLETSDSRMSRIARNEIYFQRDVPLAQVAAGGGGVHERRRRAGGAAHVPARVAGRDGPRRPEGRAHRRGDPRRVTTAVPVEVVRVRPGPAPLDLPRYMSPDAAGLDLLADVEH